MNYCGVIINDADLRAIIIQVIQICIKILSNYMA